MDVGIMANRLPPPATAGRVRAASPPPSPGLQAMLRMENRHGAARRLAAVPTFATVQASAAVRTLAAVGTFGTVPAFGAVRWITAALALAAGGCSARNSLIVRQDSAPPTQQHMKLASDWGYYADHDQGRLSCLLAFPLPASRAGPRDFLLYLSLPAAEGTHAIAPSDEAGGRGFFIQKKGRLRGITYLAGGRATVRDVWMQPGRKRVELELDCDDATRLTGSGTLESAPSELDAFEARYVHDLERMIPATQPASSPGAGEPRRGDP